MSPDRGQDLDAGDARHLEVGQHDVGRGAFQLLEARLPSLGRRDIETLVLEQNAERLEDSLLIVDDEDRWCVRHYAASSFRRAAGK